jgi:DNA end-binding protein Ku
MERAEVDAAAPETTKTIDIGDFVEIEEIDPIYFEKSYFLEPTEVGVKPFNLLRRALEETGRVAVAKVAIRAKERLATLRTYESTLVLETMFWPDEIRSVDDLDLPAGKAAAPAPREVEMARTLIDTLASHFDPNTYKDEFRGALLALVERKMKGETRAARRRKPEPKVTDLMEALKVSLEASKAGHAAKAGGRAAKASARRTSRTQTRAHKAA